MIGQLTFSIGAEQYVASLSDDLQWLCDDEEIRELLDRVSPTDYARGWADANIGRHLLFRASARLGGEVVLENGVARKLCTA